MICCLVWKLLKCQIWTPYFFKGYSHWSGKLITSSLGRYVSRGYRKELLKAVCLAFHISRFIPKKNERVEMVQSAQAAPCLWKGRTTAGACAAPRWWQCEGDLLFWSALLLGSTTAKAALSGRGKGTYGKNQSRAASGALGSLSYSQFLADTVGKERGFSLPSAHAWPSHLQSLRDKHQGFYSWLTPFPLLVGIWKRGDLFVWLPSDRLVLEL